MNSLDDHLNALQVEYKFVVLAADGVNAAAWQAGNNSVLAVQAGEEALEVFDNWWASISAHRLASSCLCWVRQQLNKHARVTCPRALAGRIRQDTPAWWR